MLTRFLISLLFLATPAAAMGPWKPACGDETPCQVGARSYHVLPPDDWDQASPLPVLMHFHGWMRQGSLVINHQRIASATRKRGVLLVAPNGQRKTWNFWNRNTDDVPFAAAVLADVAKTYPVDTSRIYVSGYSFGSAMAWRYVCEQGDPVAALLAISGTLDQTETCPQAPGQVRHVHGLDDTVMDFPMGRGGDVTYPVMLWRDQFKCGAGVSDGQWQARAFLTFDRTVWECPDGRVSLDLHPGGHFIPHGWIARQLDELLGLVPSYP
ncbi:MAG: PHB depolymerase family esterase [Roseobacter sp.]